MDSILDEHLGYLSDDKRYRLFEAAVAAAIKPGDLVADVGCGVGILGLLCLHKGAAKVWGIDSTPIVTITRETMALAGLGERYTCINERSFRATLPERVDVVICDHVGYFGFDYGVIGILQDARKRFLKPNGRILPSYLRPMLGAVQGQHLREKATAWRRGPIQPEYHWLAEYGLNIKHSVTLKRDDVISAPAVLGDIDLAADNPEFLSFKTDLRVERDGMVEGLGGWFECELAPGIWMTNSPVSADAIGRGHVYLPISEPLAVKAGDVLHATIMARPDASLLSWTLHAPATGQRFKHSTFRSAVLAPEDLARSQLDRVRHLSPAGLARRIVMGYCDGVRTGRDIEQAVLRDHPDLFPTRDEILRFVAAELGRDTQ